MRSTLGRGQNGKEGVCEDWDSEKGQMHVRFPDGSVKAYAPGNLQKVKVEADEELEPEAVRVLQLFQAFDTNGDGILDSTEFANVLNSIGLPVHMVPKFLSAIDKDGDNQVSYEEFIQWAMAKTPRMGKTRSEAMWPKAREVKHSGVAQRLSIAEQQNHDLPTDDTGEHPVDKHAPLPEDEDGFPELTEKDLERICNSHIPKRFPPHGLKVLNNMHHRFPEYPLEDILAEMRKHDYVGGKVMHAIRQSGTKEVESFSLAAVQLGPPDAFPAIYHNRSPTNRGILFRYAQKDKDFSFRNLRAETLHPHAQIEHDATFQLYEVRRGAEFGICFGRTSSGNNPLWVVLGMEMAGPANLSGSTNLDFTNAYRVTPYKAPEDQKRRESSHL
jgi:hypothetical protein